MYFGLALHFQISLQSESNSSHASSKVNKREGEGYFWSIVLWIWNNVFKVARFELQSSKQQPEDTLLPRHPSVAQLSLLCTSNHCVVIMHMPTQTNVYPVFIVSSLHCPRHDCQWVRLTRKNSARISTYVQLAYSQSFKASTAITAIYAVASKFPLI